MSSQGWRKNTPVTRRLTESAGDYSFVQAVRLLESASVVESQDKKSKKTPNPVAGFVPPATEAIRFKSHQALTFPAGEVNEVSRSSKKGKSSPQWQMMVNLLGLSGPTGVLPFHYTELILSRQKNKDNTLEHFLNLFNHRTTSLYFQASIKYRLPLQYERNELFPSTRPTQSAHTKALLSLIGLGSEGLNNRLYTKDESLLYYGGLFNQKIRTASNLKQLLRAHFKIPVEINQFVGQWQPLIDDVRSKFPDLENPTGRNVRLGQSAMLGSRGWFAQGKIHIVLGPLDKQQLKKFAPGTDSLKALNELVRMYVGMENDYEFIIRINKKDIPAKTALSKKNPPIAGWSTWLGGKPQNTRNKDETLDISVSASRLR